MAHYLPGTKHSELRKLLYDAALSRGVEIRLCAPVASIDAYERCVVLESGEKLRADVIIGADGPEGISRREVVEEPEEPPTTCGLNMYR